MGWDGHKPWLLVGLVALAALLLLNLPLFLCMPLATDVSLYDFCARNVLRGGVHYRDVFENNFPGIVWLHAVIRSAVGWRSESLRAVDWVIISGIVWLLVRWLRALHRPGVVQLWTAAAFFGFYFSTSEWCHCQRDTWMLLPALAALHLRRLQVMRMADATGRTRRALLLSVLEGVVWGTAFWIKPFVAVPALAGWLASAVLSRRRGGSFGALAADAAGLLVGGVLIGALGCLWLWTSGSWPYFWDVFLHWNAEYYTYGRSRSASSVLMRDLLLGAMPWILLHVLAVPVALVTLGRGLARSRHGEMVAAPQVLMAAFYAGWLGQAVFFQNLADYIYVPPMLLAITLLAGLPLPAKVPRLGWVVLVLFVLAAAWLHPAIRPPRARLWLRCLQEGSTPEIKNGLALIGKTDWEELDRVRGYLSREHVGDGELVCFSAYTVPLYLQLDVNPPIRFVYFDVHYFQYLRHWIDLRETLLASRPRFIVSDLRELIDTWPHKATRPGPISLPADFPANHREQYPWSLPIVFQAGRYAVHVPDEESSIDGH
jgi:hypothetical protein